MAFCEFCNKWITQPEKTRKKRFCNSTCRHNFWYGKNKKGKTEEKLESKVNYVTPTPAAFDGPKLERYVGDEIGQTAPLDMEKLKDNLLKQQSGVGGGLVFALSPLEAQKLMRRLWDEKFELDSPEGYDDWLARLYTSRLSDKQKDLVKTTNQR